MHRFAGLQPWAVREQKRYLSLGIDLLILRALPDEEK
jgi:hypothetical protein